jgi:glycyl-tRNA synthetase beta chain
MIEHQRYFPVFDQGGQLLPYFIGVRNGTDYSLDVVRAGNERVIKARLEDALFFWNEDKKKGLAAMVPGLQNVMFHERLGSVLEKVERLRGLAAFISQEYRLGNAAQVDRAAYLCKADLLSSMVYEFPELQGIMGRYYALTGGEEAPVAEAIFEHYLPRSAGDKLPATENGVVLSLAEKIYNLTAFFAIGIKPSGSQDPYALRRQALGVVNIIIGLGLKIDLPLVISQAYRSLAAVNPERSEAETVTELIEFILQRLRGVMLERGISYDLVDAVLALDDVNINQLILRAEAVRDFKNHSLWEGFMVVFNRSFNLSKKWDSSQVNHNVLTDPSEKELYELYLELKPQIENAISEIRYIGGLELLAGLRPSIDRFFDAVMVMAEDEELKAARLGILKAVANLCCSIADFSKIVS